MPTGPEQDLMNAAVEYLRLHGFMVFHQRPCRTNRGWASAIEYDGLGFPDLVAARSDVGCIFIEVKAGTKVSADQQDWLSATGGLVLTPNRWQLFTTYVNDLVDGRTVPRETTEMLQQRQWRHHMKKTKASVADDLQDGTFLPQRGIHHVQPINTPFSIGTSTVVYLYKGTASDGSVTGYGPVVWLGARERWQAKQRAKYRVFGADRKIKFRKNPVSDDVKN